MMLHDCNKPKPIFLDFVCRKGIPFTKKKSIAISTFLWCLAMGGGKGTLSIFLWLYGLLMMDLTGMVVICGPYIEFALFMSSIVIGQFLI